jgi:hypothetical protein
MQDKHKFKQLGLIYEAMDTGGRDPQGGYSPEDEDAEDAASSDSSRTQTDLVYSLIRDLAAENPGKDPAGYLQVFSTYSAFVKRAKNLINRIDNRPQR